jgi:hypothetical protein
VTRRWSLLLCLAPLVGCSSSESAPDDGDPASEGEAYDPASYCGVLTARLRECGVLSQGRYDCANYLDPAEDCETACLANAACTDIVDFQCNFRGSIGRCMEGCIGLTSFTCLDGTVISAYRKCDGIEDCSDGDDEEGCNLIGGYKCRNVDSYVDSSFYCDGVEDCSDGSDEVPDCGPELTCDGGMAVSGYEVCNGYESCADGSDEPSGCAAITCN